MDPGLSERMEGEEVCFCYFLWDQNQCSSLLRIIFVSQVNFIIFEKSFDKKKEASRHERK